VLLLRGAVTKSIAITDTKQTRVVKRTVPTESFFNFFTPPKPPTDSDEDDEDQDDIEDRLELDYQLGEDIKEKLIPRAVDWFTGEARQFEGMGADMEGEFEDDDDNEDTSDDDREDDEDESDDDVCGPTFYPQTSLVLTMN